MPIVLPVNLTTDAEKYRCLYAAVEAVRLKHNSRARDSSAAAHAYRLECRKLQSAMLDEILTLRPRIRDEKWTPDSKEPEPNHPRLKAEGRDAYESADLKAITGTDLDTFAAEREPPPDPTENFTTYTEVDEDSDITVAASSLTVDSMRNDAVSYVYKDAGADHFLVGLLHYVTVNVSAWSNYVQAGFWAVTNVYGTQVTMASQQAVGAYIYNAFPAGAGLYLENFETAESDSYDSGLSTSYYCAADWSGATTIQLKIYSDSGHTSLLDTLAVTVTSGRKYRYVQGVYSYGGASSESASYVASNLDLNEGAPAQSNAPRAMHYYRTRRAQCF